MKIYNTLTGNMEEVQAKDNQIRIYLCGVTVYDYSHLGHARTVIVFDVLRRYLIHKGYQVKFVQNFTDVDDKIINTSKELGIEPKELSEKFIKQYFEDFDPLNVMRADEYPKATDHVEEMQELIGGLIEKNFAYVADNGVYFHVSSDKEYGKLSKKPIDELKAGARVEVDPSKKDPSDFALWKFYDYGPLWDSPWGKGRPGWHIECSAMSIKYLGNCFEIHGGGEDLIFPHHENEIAQSECHTGSKFAKQWMHVSMVTIRGEKMAKSLKNITSIHSALKKWSANGIRIYCLSGHYRKTLDYDDQLLADALARWCDIETCVYELEFADDKDDGTVFVDEATKLASDTFKEFTNAMDDDLNTPIALTAFTSFVRTINRYAADDKLNMNVAAALEPTFDAIMFVLGLKIGKVDDEERKEIEFMVEKRNELRAQKKFTEADRIREQLKTIGVELMDHKRRTVWKKLT